MRQLREAKDCVAEGKIYRAIVILETLVADFEDYSKLVTQLRARFNRFTTDTRTGVISYDDTRVIYNKITLDLLGVIEELERDEHFIRQLSSKVKKYFYGT